MTVRVRADDLERVSATLRVLYKDRARELANNLKQEVDREIDQFFYERRQRLRGLIVNIIDDLLIRTAIDIDVQLNPDDKTYTVNVSVDLPDPGKDRIRIVKS